MPTPTLFEILSRCADGAPLPAEKINVRLPSSTEYAGPLMRQLTRVYWKRKHGTRWLYWEWTPEPRSDGVRDCGFSGITENNPNL